MAILLIDYIEAINLNDAVIFDVTKSKAPKFVGRSKSGLQFQCLKKFLSDFNVSLFYHTL